MSSVRAQRRRHSCPPPALEPVLAPTKESSKSLLQNESLLYYRVKLPSIALLQVRGVGTTPPSQTRPCFRFCNLAQLVPMNTWVSPGQIKAIQKLSQHIRVKHQAYGLVLAGASSTLLTLGALGSTAAVGYYVLLYHRVIWWEYGGAAAFTLLSLIFTGLLSHDIR